MAGAEITFFTDSPAFRTSLFSNGGVSSSTQAWSSTSPSRVPPVFDNFPDTLSTKSLTSNGMRMHRQQEWGQQTQAQAQFVSMTRVAGVSQWTEVASTCSSHVFGSHWSTQSQSVSQESLLSDDLAIRQSGQDDFQLPTEPLDVQAQLGKGHVGRKGSLGGRRPPTSRSRRSSSGSIARVNTDEDLLNNTGSSHWTTTISTEVAAPLLATPDPQHSIRASPESPKKKVPPPRPPPPKINTRVPASVKAPATNERLPDTLKYFFMADTSPTSPKLSEENSSIHTPPPLPRTMAPTTKSSTPESYGSFDASPKADVVDIRDKESVEDGHVVRRRTVVTLGSASRSTDVLTSPTPSDEPAWKRNLKARRSLRSQREIEGRITPESPKQLSSASFSERSYSNTDQTSSGHIKVTINGSSSLCGDTMEAHHSCGRTDEPEVRPARASAFNVRRTIEQRRNAQQRDTRIPMRSNTDEDGYDGSASSVAKSVSLTSIRDDDSMASTPYASEQNWTEERPDGPMGRYLFGSTASSQLSGDRTISMSMSFSDLDSNEDLTSSKRRGGKKSEAWYERRQSYGFEGADKWKSQNDDAGSENSGRSTRLSRSYDSIESRSMANSDSRVPPWLRTSQREREIPESPENRYVSEPQPQHVALTKPLVTTSVPVPKPPPATNTFQDDRLPRNIEQPEANSPSVELRSRPRSTTYLLEEENKPIWLRDLKARRSLRETKSRCSDSATEPVGAKSPPEPPWKNVRLRPTGVKLVGEPGNCPNEPAQETVRRIQVGSDPRSSPPASSISESRAGRLLERTHRQSQDRLSTPTASDDQLDPSFALRHQKSVELMKLIDETPYVFRNADEPVSSASPQQNPQKVGHPSVLHIKQDPRGNPTPVQPIAAQIERIPEPPIYIAIETRPISQPEPSDTDAYSDSTLPTSMEDLTQPKKPKRVGFAQGVKEESDKVSRPKRRTRSPEARLKEWQAKKETRFGDCDGENSGGKVTMFGDLEAEIPESAKVYVKPVSIPISSTSSASQAETKTTTVSSTFLSILQRRPLDTLDHVYHEPTPVTAKSMMDEASHDPSFPYRFANGTSSTGLPHAYPTQSPSPLITPSQVETANIVVISAQEPQPKSILKKRSLDNLLTIENVTTLRQAAANGFVKNPIFQKPSNLVTAEIPKPVSTYQFSSPHYSANSDPPPFSVTILPSPSTKIVTTQSEACPIDSESPRNFVASASHPVNVSPTPWGVHWKHVDPPRKVSSIEVKTKSTGSWLPDTRPSQTYQPKSESITPEPLTKFSSDSAQPLYTTPFHPYPSFREASSTPYESKPFNAYTSTSEAVTHINNQPLTLKDFEDDSEAELSDFAHQDREDCSSTAWSETSSIIQTNFDRSNDHATQAIYSSLDAPHNSEVHAINHHSKSQPFKISHTIVEHFNKHLLGTADLQFKTADGNSNHGKFGSQSLEYDQLPIQHKPFASLPTKMAPNSDTASQLTSIRLRPIGRPKTPEYEEPDQRQAQPSLRKPLSPKIPRIDPRTLANHSLPLTTYVDPAQYRTADAYRIRNDMVIIKTRVKTTDIPAQDVNCSHQTGLTEKEVDDNWTLSSPNRSRHSDTLESSQVELGPKLPSLGNPSVSWTPIEKETTSLRTKSLDTKMSPFKASSSDVTSIKIQYSHSTSSSQPEHISNSPGKENMAHYEKDFLDTASKLSSQEFLPDPIHPWRKRRSSSIRSHDSRTSRDFDDCVSEPSGQHSDCSQSVSSTRQSTERELKASEPEPDWIRHVKERSIERDWESIGKASTAINTLSAPWVDQVKLRSPVLPTKTSNIPKPAEHEESMSPWKKELEERKRHSFQALVNLERESAEFASSLQVKEDANMLHWDNDSFNGKEIDDELASRNKTGGELTGGMPEDKASRLVRKFFTNAPNNPETKFQKFAKTETIVEETATESESVQDKEEKRPVSQTLSLDSDELFRISTTDLTSDFGSALDILNTSADQGSEIHLSDDRSMTPKSLRLCAERDRPHVRLSDILKRTLQGKINEDFDPLDLKPSHMTSKSHGNRSSNSPASSSDTRSTKSTYSSSSSQRSSFTNPTTRKMKPEQPKARLSSGILNVKNNSTSRSQPMPAVSKAGSASRKPDPEIRKRMTKTPLKPQPTAVNTKTKLLSKTGQKFTYEREETVDPEGRSTKSTTRKVVLRGSRPMTASGEEVKETLEKRHLTPINPKESRTSALRKKIRVKADAGYVTTKLGTNGHQVTENVQNKSVSSRESVGGGGFTATREIRGDTDRRIIVQQSSNPSGVNSARSRTVTKSSSITTVTSKRFNGTANFKTGL